VYILEQGKSDTKQLQPVIKVPLKLQDYVKLDNGTAHLGFAQDTFYLVNYVVIESWHFSSDAKAN
jgi:hypothetical protein